MPAPLLLYLPFSLLEHGFNLARLLAADPDRSWSEGYVLLEAFDVTRPEREFARTLLRDKTNLWLFRCNQRCYCGDFVVVDMSPPSPKDRVAQVIELKQGATLSIAARPERPKGARGTGIQLANHRDAVAELAATSGIVSADCTVELISGSPDRVLERLGLTVRPARAR